MITLFPTKNSDPELAPFRPGLVFAFFNALAWQIGIGTPMVLFAEQLGASPFQVGLAYSFVFVLTPLQIVSTALLPRYGFKTVMLGGWGTRSVFLGVPMALAALALGSGARPWMILALIGSVFLFCVFRSIGAASSNAWFYAILPEGVRGRYFASDQFVSAVGGVGTLLASAALFAFLPVYTALLAQYAIALGGSTVSYFALKRLPDAERPRAISLRTVAADTPRHLFAPSPFRTYVWLAVLCAVLVTPIPPFCAYYLKVGPKLGPGQIMLFEVARYLGVMTGAWIVRRRIDATGARPFFLVALALYLAAGAYWLLFLRTHFGGSAGVFAAYFVLGLGAVLWTVANLNYLPKVVSAEDRTLAVAVHGAATATLGGVSPVLWGLLLRRGDIETSGLNVAAFEWFFIVVMAGAALLWWRMARLEEDKGEPADPIMIGNAILRPFRAMTYLVNLIEPVEPKKEEPKPPGA